MGSLMQGIAGNVGKDTARDSENVNTPLGVTRGLDSQTPPELPKIDLGLHWVRGSIKSTHLTKFTRYLSIWFGDQHVRQRFGLWFFDRSTRWPSGVMLNYHSDRSREALTDGMITVEIPGDALDRLGMRAVGAFAFGLRQFEFQATRLDLYFDDHERTITPSELYNLVYQEDQDGQCTKHDFTGFRDIGQITRGGNEGRKMDQCIFGHRGSSGSGKYLRVYDKKLETNGENKAVRWEAELCKRKARLAWEEISVCNADEQQLTSRIGAIIGGLIDFRMRGDRAGDRNISRLDRYPFWELILERLGRSKLTEKVLPKTIERAVEWTERQVAGSLQMIRKAKGDETFYQWLIDMVDGESRLKPDHINAILEYGVKHDPEKRFDVLQFREYCDGQGIEYEDDG